MKLTVVSSVRRFAALRDEWDNLARICNHSTVFQTWEWNYAWWTCYSRSSLKARLNAQLHIVELREGADLVGILPLWRSRRRKAIRFVGEHATDYLMPIIAPAREPEVVQALKEHVDILALSASVDLIDVPADHPFALAWPESARSNGSECPRVDLPESAEELLKGISSNLRHSIRKGDREILQNGRGTFLDADAGEAAAAYDRFEQLYAMRAQVKGLDRALNDPHRARFWRMFCEVAGPKGLLRLKLLEIDGSSACGVLCFFYKGTTSYYAQGMDPRFAPLAPGNLTLWRAVEDAIGEGARVFDFLRGNEEFKMRWRPIVANNVDLHGRST
jgi:CelD/BcsL family acetyltransferase involved in cellulose biosynthesis